MLKRFLEMSDSQIYYYWFKRYPARRGTDNMSMQTNLEALIEAAQHLTREEQQKLLDALRSSPPLKPPHRITELRGLGKDLWRGVDARDYLNAERDSWDN